MINEVPAVSTHSSESYNNQVLNETADLHKQLMTNCKELEFPIRAELLTSFLCVQSEWWIYSIGLFRAIIDLIVYIEIHCLLIY